MCSEQHGVNWALENLRQPMPLPRKLHLVTRNLFRRVIHLSDCCGHPGEPGC